MANPSLKSVEATRCTKVAYFTKADAKDALHRAWAARESGVVTRAECRWYRCPDCRLYHLTSKPARNSQEAV